ncbi:hypothetical protein FQA39_LY10263 [Lamprigera yunnana]|nr:hypothetical protein FQA39_LY10263 [Lamprigera yunnana]
MSLKPIVDESTNVARKKIHICTFGNCTAVFSKNSKLVYHIRRHTGERPFRCDVPNCDKSYLYSFHLRRHKETHSNKQKHEGLKCPTEGCNLELANKYSLKKHMKRKHNSEREYPFTCETCNQGFTRKKRLLQHSFTHTGEYPFECPICQTKFLTVTALMRHKRTHTTYTCDCGTEFERWTMLVVHKRTCQTSWYCCSKCNKRFKQLNRLNIHFNTHFVSDVTFICGYEECGRSYLYKRNLAQHIKRYHQNIVKKIQCPMFGDNCKQIFTKNQNIKYHMRRFHSNEAFIKKTIRKPRKDKGTMKNIAIMLTNAVASQPQLLSALNDVITKENTKWKDNVVEKAGSSLENTKATENVVTTVAKKTEAKLVLRSCGSESSDVCDESENEHIKFVC